jgi:anti-sigma regulatory factor (Ser/Thr protein kinase)
LEIILTNQPGEAQRLFKALEEFAAEHDLPAKAVQAADLALEEHVTNVLNHGYTDTAPHEICVRLSCIDRLFAIEVKDDGRPFNPLEQPEVDTTIPLEERPMGGLGIHLMRKFMDSLEYRRVGEHNLLRMTKRLEV